MTRVAVSIAVSVVVVGAMAGAHAAGETVPSRLVLELKDGSLVIGQPAVRTMPILTQVIGRVEMRVAAIDTIAFQADNETAVVQFRSGDTLRGVIALPSVAVRTERGEVSTPLADVSRVMMVADGGLKVNDGLVAHYPFSGDAKDASGKGNHGARHGATLCQDRFGTGSRAYAFDGVDDYIEVPASASLGADGAVTVTAWIRRNPGEAKQHIVRQGNFERRKYRYGLMLFGGSSIAFNAHDGAAWHGAGQGDRIAANRWYHVAGVYDAKASVIRLHVNGVEVARRGDVRATAAEGEPVTIGAEYYHQRGAYFDGVIDDVRLYNRALSRGEVLDLYLLERQAPPAPPVATGYVLTEPPKADASKDAWRPDERTRVASRIILQRGRPVRTRVSIDAEIDELRKLLASGAVSRAVFDREMNRLDTGGEGGGLIDDFTGRMQVLTRLYHKGEITTDAFLRHHTPVWNAWYRTINILPNGDFEAVEDRAAPPRLVDLVNWQEAIMGYGDIGHSRLEIDRMVKHRGKQSLKFMSTQGPSLISLYSMPFMVERDDSIKIQFFVKAKELKRGYTGRAGTLNFATAGNSLDLRPALRVYIPEGTYDWTMMEARLQIFGNIPEGRALPCRLAFEFFGEGTLWLDDIVVCPTTRRSSQTGQPTPRP